MGITIHKILHREQQYTFAELTRGSERILAKVWDQENNLKTKIGEEDLVVEINTTL
jgi:hypothetical protein